MGNRDSSVAVATSEAAARMLGSGTDDGKVQFGYGDHGVQDHGWGCVYRNIQTAYNSRNPLSTVPTLHEMLLFFGFPSPPVAGRSVWIEPQDACRFLSVHNIPCTHAATSPDGKRESLKVHLAGRFTRTDLDSVQEVWTPEAFAKRCFDHLASDPRAVVILDNGTFSYTLLKALTLTSKNCYAFLMGDPHQPQAHRRIEVIVADKNSRFFGPNAAVHTACLC